MGRNFWLQNGHNLLCKVHVCPSGQRSKGRILCSQLAALCNFQNLLSDFGNCDFLENRKNSFLQKFPLFNVFQCSAPSCSHAQEEFVENLVNENTFLKKCVSTFFAPETQRYQLTTLNFR